MSKAFTRENDAADDGDELEPAQQLPQGLKNYITPAGYQRLKDEFDHLWKAERPVLVQTITWAASNGDRSENGDYIYGKKRLRGIDHFGVVQPPGKEADTPKWSIPRSGRIATRCSSARP